MNAIPISCNNFDFLGMGYTNTDLISNWEWFFGDGGSANTQNANHIYVNGGVYPVKLIVTDLNGCKDSTTYQIETKSVNPDFNYDIDICDPLNVKFIALGSNLPNPYWDFGDGNTTTQPMVLHTYTGEGEYLVKFSLFDGLCGDTVRKTISLRVLQDNIVLTPDTVICLNSNKQLRSAPSLDFCWSPSLYLDDPNSPNPVTSTPQNITYYLTALVAGSNLITNGNFSQGNTSFTSEYSYSNNNATEGQYYVGANPQTWNGGLSACKDHTTGAGNMMLINGSPAPDLKVWTQTVAVVPNTNYAFSTWIQALYQPNPAQLSFSINSKEIGHLITASLSTCNWTQFYTTWNSGENTSATIAIINKNTQVQGNDFALDDISFSQFFIRRDSVKITVDTPFITANQDTTICYKSPVQLVASGAQIYSWSPANDVSDPSISNPVVTPSGTTEYIVAGTNINGCVAKDTVTVAIFAIPAITVTNDSLICKNASIALLATGGANYTWSPEGALNNPGIANPVATPLNSTMYHVSVEDNNSCIFEDSVMISIRPNPVFTINAGKSICDEDSIQLRASGGNVYTWQPAINLTDNTISDPIASPSTSTTYTVIIEEKACGNSAVLTTVIAVNPLPNVQAFKSNDLDCSTASSQLSANGALHYTWLPSGSLSNSSTADPIATPVENTKYIVYGRDAVGCSNSDSVTVEVKNTNKSGYLMPDAFTPNNDGLNDCYAIKYWGRVEQLQLSIYNRWGQRVFYTTDPNKCWDGTVNGVKQDSGVFVYMVRAKTFCESSVFKKGTLVLIR